MKTKWLFTLFTRLLPFVSEHISIFPIEIIIQGHVNHKMKSANHRNSDSFVEPIDPFSLEHFMHSVEHISIVLDPVQFLTLQSGLGHPDRVRQKLCQGSRNNRRCHVAGDHSFCQLLMVGYEHQQ